MVHAGPHTQHRSPYLLPSPIGQPRTEWHIMSCYIMPDGRRLSAYLRAESVSGSGAPSKKKKGGGLRGKDELWAQVIHHKAQAQHSTDLSDMAELKMLENAGMRRRRRWLNDKTLRWG